MANTTFSGLKRPFTVFANKNVHNSYYYDSCSDGAGDHWSGYTSFTPVKDFGNLGFWILSGTELLGWHTEMSCSKVLLIINRRFISRFRANTLLLFL